MHSNGLGDGDIEEMTSDQIDTTLSVQLPRVLNGAKRVLLIVPDTTRTAPIADLVQRMLPIIRDCGTHADIIVALGTHLPMARPDLLKHLGFTEESYSRHFSNVRLMNHEWDNPNALIKVGVIEEKRVREISAGLMSESVDLTINRVIADYDRLLILGPVFPHEIAGYSGGSKYLFPGISGPEIIDAFHWLGAVITNLEIIGKVDNPVREILREAAGLVPVPVSAISIVTRGETVAHISAGEVDSSWREAADVSSRLHVVRKPRRFSRVLSCAPLMYDDLWTGGKCMYKCESVVEDGGELIIYAPHVDSLSVVHGEVLERIGYHVRDYFLSDMARFADAPRSIMAVATLIKGAGVFENGQERPRIRVSVASQIPAALCELVDLGYCDPADIDLNEWKNREEEGIFCVEKAGETLYLYDDSPA